MEIISLPLGILAFIALVAVAAMLIVGGAYLATTGGASTIAFGIFLSSLGVLIGSVLALMLWELKEAPDDECSPDSCG